MSAAISLDASGGQLSQLPRLVASLSRAASLVGCIGSHSLWPCTKDCFFQICASIGRDARFFYFLGACIPHGVSTCAY